MTFHCPYSPSYRSQRVLPNLALCAWMLASAATADNRLVLESGAGRAGPVAWLSARVELAPGDPGRWALSVDELVLGGEPLSFNADCRQGGLQGGRPWCARGRFEMTAGDSIPIVGQMRLPASGGPGLGFEFASSDLTAELNWSRDGPSAVSGLRVEFAEYELSELPHAVAEALGLSQLEGLLSGTIDWSGLVASADLTLEQGAFDRSDGEAAGAGLSIEIAARLEPGADDAPSGFSLSLVQTEGELLVGPVYLPSPAEPLVVDASGSYEAGERLVLDQLELIDGSSLTARAGAAFIREADAWALDRLDVEEFSMRLPTAWQRWGDGPAAGLGLGDLETRGELSGTLALRPDGSASMSADLDDVGVRDAQGRFAIEGLSGRLERSADRLDASLSWSGLSLFKLAFGGSELSAAGTPEDWRLTQPLIIPLLDGAVVFDALSVDEDDSGRSVALDLRVEPLELAGLTRMLGLPVFGGQLSGQFPGVRVSGDRIEFTGGIDMRAFSGRIGLSELVVERPFGALPALAAQVEFERLNLAELTGAFNFGHIEGQLSGWMRDLRLLDWQPVAMDTRLFTHDDAPSRRISQRAVENLSRLGGGAAAIGATLLRVFEEFPYRRAGLACRLDRNICHIDGVAPHESGGFYIVEGRGLPHLDVVGHRRLVDWPRLVAQLVAMTEG